MERTATIAAETEPELEPSNGYAKGRKRRETIINAAYDYFSSYGYQGSSLRDIASSIGVTHAGLRYHFEAKEDLLVAVLERYAQEGDQLFSMEHVGADSAGQCPWSAIASLINSIQFSLDNPGFIRLFSAQALLSSEPESGTDDFFVKRMDTVRGSYARLVESLQDQKIMRAELDPTQAATLILASLEGLYMQHLVQPDRRNVMTHVHLLLRAMCIADHHEQLSEAFGAHSALIVA